MTSEISNEEFIDRLVRYGFVTPIPDDTFVFDPEMGGMVWSNDLNRKLWHGIPIRKLRGLNVVGLLAEIGYTPKKKDAPQEHPPFFARLHCPSYFFKSASRIVL